MCIVLLILAVVLIVIIVEKNRLIDLMHTEIFKAHTGLTNLQQRAEGAVHTDITNLLADLKKHL